MKKIIYFSLALILFCSCLGSKPDLGANKIAIEAMLNAQVKAWNAGDITAFMDGYQADSTMQFIGKKGVRKGWQQTLDAYKKHYSTKDSMGQLVFALDNIQFLDKEASLGHITGKWKLIRNTDTPTGYFSLITRGSAKGPKIIIDHTW